MLSLKGRRTGIFTRLNTFHKHTLGFHKAVGRGNFKSMEEAQKWLTTRRRFLKEDSNEILASKKKNLSLVYTDGSYNNSQKKYGCAIIVFDVDGSIQTFTKANANKCGSAHAEVEALYLCLKVMADVCHQREFVLVHDYNELKRVAEGTLEIKNVDPRMQKAIVQFIKDREIIVHFLLVKAHNGNIGNTLADKCAKEAVKNFIEYEKLRTTKGETE